MDTLELRGIMCLQMIINYIQFKKKKKKKRNEITIGEV